MEHPFTLGVSQIIGRTRMIGKSLMRRDGLKALIFDLDGTLVESEPAWEAAKRIVLARHAITVTQGFLDAFVGRGLRGFLADAAGATLTTDLRDQMAEEIGAEADRLLPLLRQPKAGATAFLRATHASGLRVAICSSSPRRHILQALDQLGTADLVDTIVSGADLTHGKPDPMPYLETLRLMSLTPNEAAVVEDAVPGFHSARAAGLAVIGIGATAMQPEHAGLLALAIPDFAALSARIGLA